MNILYMHSRLWHTKLRRKWSQPKLTADHTMFWPYVSVKNCTHRNDYTLTGQFRECIGTPVHLLMESSDSSDVHKW